MTSRSKKGEGHGYCDDSTKTRDDGRGGVEYFPKLGDAIYGWPQKTEKFDVTQLCYLKAHSLIRSRISESAL